MGQSLSVHQRQDVLVLRLLQASEASVSEDNLYSVLYDVVQNNPLFPEKGILDLDVWECSGQNLKCHFKRGHKVSSKTFPTWALICTALAPLHIAETEASETKVPEKETSAPSDKVLPPPKPSVPIRPADKGGGEMTMASLLPLSPLPPPLPPPLPSLPKSAAPVLQRCLHKAELAKNFV
ncbi:uncharacterized protein LOC119529671 [Choloepus didactylus]|uniref:uncharacterized protein LOC119529671 n=1 Tax=Choloepus didactylus TaxID=27675 RepID=UPI00189FBBF9|nr:uncharacterized protein LOC119529671 [Choloepus didactylus]